MYKVELATEESSKGCAPDLKYQRRAFHWRNQHERRHGEDKLS